MAQQDWRQQIIQGVADAATKTLALRANQVGAIENLGGNIHFFHPDLGIHLGKATLGRYTRREDVPEQTYKGMFSAVLYSSILPFFFPIFEDEYSAFITDLVCGAYSSARRTLRWLLETSIWTCDFQTDPSVPIVPMICNHILETSQAVDEYEQSCSEIWPLGSSRIKRSAARVDSSPRSRELGRTTTWL